jgi:hypothetical protein
MPLTLMLFAVMAVVVVIVNEALDMPYKRRLDDAGRSRMPVETTRARVRLGS